jgi:hypothetical protein
MDSSTLSRSLYAGLMRGRSSGSSSSSSVDSGSSSSSSSSSGGGNTTAPTVPREEGLHVRGLNALAGIYAGLLRGGSVPASDGGSRGAGNDKTNTSASLPAAVEGSGRIVIRISEGIDAQFAGKGCAAGCEKWGTCDRELGVCRCAVKLHNQNV